MVGSSLQYAWNATLSDRRGNATLLQRVSRDAKAAAPEGAVYPNESDPWVEDWQDAYWGDGYARLLRVKIRYDPDGLASCWKCVGFRGGGKGTGDEGEFGCWEAFAGLV